MELKPWPYSSTYASTNYGNDLLCPPKDNPKSSEIKKKRRVQPVRSMVCLSALLLCVSISIGLISLSISLYIVVYAMNMNSGCFNASIANVERNMTYPHLHNYTVLLDEIELLKSDILSLKLLLIDVTNSTNHQVEENAKTITHQAQLQDNITTQTNYKIEQNAKAITCQVQLLDNITTETNYKIEENVKAITHQAQSIATIDNEVTSILENNVTSLFQLLSNITVTPVMVTNTSKEAAILEDLPSFQDALNDNCTFIKLSSCTLSTVAQYGSAIPTFWSCKTSPVMATAKKLGNVQCIVTEYGSEINPIGASLSLTELNNGTMEYRCLCSVIVATTIWRQSSVTCSLVHSFCIARDSVNVTLSHA